MDLAGEENKLGLVLLQAVNVGLEELLAAVLAAVVNRDSNTLGLEAGDASGLADEWRNKGNKRND